MKHFFCFIFLKLGTNKLPFRSVDISLILLNLMYFNFKTTYYWFPSRLLYLSKWSVNRRIWFSGFILCIYQISPPNNSILRGEKLISSLLLRKSKNLLFLGPWSPVGDKVYRVCSIHASFKFFEPRPYLVCHVSTIENILKTRTEWIVFEI